MKKELEDKISEIEKENAKKMESMVEESNLSRQENGSHVDKLRHQLQAVIFLDIFWIFLDILRDIWRYFLDIFDELGNGKTTTR
jgi:hypothetical protein